MLVMVGGHSRKIGKSSVVAGLIRVLPEARWTAVKITQHAHADHSVRPYELREEMSVSGGDSGRYLAAGARRSFLLIAEEGGLAEAMPALRDLLAASENAIVESTSVLDLIRPDLFLFVLDFSAREFKESSRKVAGLADAFVILNEDATPPWREDTSAWTRNKPCFRTVPPQYVTEQLAAFVREKLRRAGARRWNPVV